MPAQAGSAPLRINVWGINYSPEVTGIAPYNTELCRFLRDQGHAVRMVTSFPYYPAWKKLAGDRGRLFRSDILDGVPVHRCWHYVPSKVTTRRRILHESTFVLLSFLRQLFLPKPDLVIVVSPPLFLGVAAWLLQRLRNCPYVFHVQDLQPDAAASLGMVRPGLFMRWLYRLEGFAYAKASLLSGISSGMLAAFSLKGVCGSKQFYFPNGVRLELPGGVPPPGLFRARQNLEADEFLAIYSGNLGVKQGLDVLIEAARRIKSASVKIIICGDGSQRQHLSGLIKALGTGNVLMLPLQDEDSYREMLRDADVCLITQQRGTGQFFLPSKLLSTLAFGKPVVTVGDESSELVKAVHEGGFGVCVPPEQPEALAAALDELAVRPERLAAFGEAGRQYVQQFDFQSVHRRFEEAIERVARQSNGSV